MRDTFRPDIEEVFEHYGARIVASGGQWQKATCPLVAHEDQSPSASVNIETGKWQCWACDKHGDVYDILKENEGIAGFPALVEFASANFERGDRSLRDEPVSRTGLPHGSRGGRRKGGPFIPPWRGL